MLFFPFFLSLSLPLVLSPERHALPAACQDRRGRRPQLGLRARDPAEAPDGAREGGESLSFVIVVTVVGVVGDASPGHIAWISARRNSIVVVDGDDAHGGRRRRLPRARDLHRLAPAPDRRV